MVIITSQSFEEETAATTDDQYNFAGTADLPLGTTVDLPNLPGGVVESTEANTGLGYSATFTDTRTGIAGAVGTSDGDTIGVVTNSAFDFNVDGVAFTDGAQGYAFGDTDGLVTLTFETVDLSNFENVSLSLDYFVRNAMYETSNGASDSFAITAVTDQGDFELLNLDPVELTAFMDGVASISFDVPASVTSLQLVVEVDTNAALEEMAVDNLVIEGDVICFLRGTQIDTDRGPRAIERLQPGDRIMGADGQAHVLRWLGASKIHARADQLPVRIKAGSWLGNTNDLCVSPAHRMLVSGWRAEALFGVSEMLVAARDLINGETIVRDDTRRQVEYWHLLLDSHQMVLAEGCLSESLDPSSSALEAMSEASRREVLELFRKLEARAIRAPALSSAEAMALL